jgi:hypothetical protein
MRSCNIGKRRLQQLHITSEYGNLRKFHSDYTHKGPVGKLHSGET